MPKKDDTRRSEPPAKNAEKLRRLSPKPDVEKPARPQSPHWRRGSWRGKAAAVSGLAPDNSTLSMKHDNTLHQRSPSTSTSSSSRLVRTLTMPGKSSLATATPTKLSITANFKGETIDRVIDDESTSNKDDEDGPTEVINDKSDNSDIHETSTETKPATTWGAWFSRSGIEEPQKASPEEGPKISDRQSQAQQTIDGEDIAVRAFGSTTTQPPDQVPLPQTSDADLQEDNHQKVDDNPALKDRPRSWFGLWAPTTGSQHAPPEVAATPSPERAEHGEDRDLEVASEESGMKTHTLQSQPAQPMTSYQEQGSWFGSWGRTTPRKAPVSDQTADSTTTSACSSTGIAGQSVPAASSESIDPPTTPKTASSSSRLSGAWGLWSRGVQHTPQDSSTAAKRGSGEIAVTGTDSQSQPKSVDVVEDGAVKQVVHSATNDSVSAGHSSSSETQTSQTISPSRSSTTISGDLTTKPPNLVLPQVHDTHKTIRKSQQPQTYTQQLYGWLGRGPPITRVEKEEGRLAAEPHRVKRAVCIGVHGFFPSAWFQKVFGPPTGTSLRFATGAAGAVEAWCSARGYTCEIEKVALEGEGMIADRVEALWKLLLNWVDHIKTADLIVMAAHSQGLPVSVMLMARLLEGGHISSEARVGIVGMAGISLGPFSTLQSRFLAPSGSIAGELFAFSSPSSTVSSMYADALRICLGSRRSAVRMTLVGSIDDQLVSLESSLFTTLSHPMIYRAAFVDGRIHAPGFLTHLVAFACKVKNLGGTDHGLLRELSTPLAGSLYGGEGHSMIYQEQEVYNLGLSWTLQSLQLDTVEDPALQPEYEPPSNNNPFFLPWAARGLLEEEIVRTQLRDEAKELLKQYDDWNPTTKPLKDVKFRLEAVRTKL